MTGVFTFILVLSVAMSDVTFTAAPAAAAPQDRSDSLSASLREQFSALAQTWLRAYNSNDTIALAGMYTADAQYISSHVRGLVAQGRDRLIANFQDGIKMGGHIDSVSVLSVQASCDLVTLLCKYEATNSGQKAVGRNLLVLKKVGSRWLIVLHMTVV